VLKTRDEERDGGSEQQKQKQAQSQRQQQQQQQHETFNTQLKRRLSSLRSKKKQQHSHHHDQKPSTKSHHCKKSQKKNEDEDNGGCDECQNREIDGEDDSCNCLIDEQDDQVNEIVSPILIRPTTTANLQQHTIDSTILSPGSISTDSSLIFERNVQDQISTYYPCGCISSTSRKNSNTNNHNFARSTSYSSQSSIPNHLNSEFFVPQVLDASTEVLINDPNYENHQVIQSTNTNLSSSLLDQSKNITITTSNSTSPITHPGMGNRRMSRSLPISRRQSSTTAPLSPISTTTSFSNTASNQNVDYSDRKKLNFCSFADLLNDESENDAILSSPNSPSRPIATGGTYFTSSGTINQQLRDPFTSKNEQQSQSQSPPPPPSSQQLGQSPPNSSMSTTTAGNFTNSSFNNPPVFPLLSKTSSIKEILLETKTELDKSASQ